MVKVYQTRPDNCWPAVLASMLEIPIEEVDNCNCSQSDWVEKTSQLLAKRGLFMVEIRLGDEEHPPGNEFQLQSTFRDRSLIIVGKGTHAYICRVHYAPKGVKLVNPNDVFFKVEFDPNPSGTVGHTLMPDSIILLCRLDQ